LSAAAGISMDNSGYNGPMRLVLFDIDGTLVLTGGAGSRALNQVLTEHYDLPLGTDGVVYAGKTDPQIVREIMDRNGQEFTEETLESVLDAYIESLEKELAEGEDFQVLPGVLELINTLGTRSDFLVGLATGNVQSGARLKLERAGLQSFFSFGGFGSDSENRTSLIQVAIDRGHEAASSSLQQVFVVGDTPRDIIHGKEAGARTVAVASGSYSLEDLISHDPDLAVGSLEPLETVLEFLTSDF